jgi:hypothetical protein
LSEELNPISQFLTSEGYEKSEDDGHILLQDLFLKYKEFCKTNQMYSISNLKFSSLLRAQGFRIEKIGRKGRRVFIKQNN